MKTGHRLDWAHSQGVLIPGLDISSFKKFSKAAWPHADLGAPTYVPMIFCTCLPATEIIRCWPDSILPSSAGHPAFLTVGCGPVTEIRPVKYRK